MRPGEELDRLTLVVDEVRKAHRELVGGGMEGAVSPAGSQGSEFHGQEPDGIWGERFPERLEDSARTGFRSPEP